MDTNKISYVAMAQQDQFPKKEQAIVTGAIDRIFIKEYIVTIGRIIGLKDIRFTSRLSNGRVCVYLSSKESVYISVIKTR